jgi:hypothetical protein
MTMRWAGHVTLTRKNINGNKILKVKPEGVTLKTGE